MSIWARSELCARLDEERATRDAAVAAAKEREHVQIVRAWRSHGMRVRVPRIKAEGGRMKDETGCLVDGTPRVPARDSMLWRIMVRLSTAAALSAAQVALAMHIDRHCAAKHLSRLQVRKMVAVHDTRQGDVYRYRLSVMGRAALEGRAA